MTTGPVCAVAVPGPKYYELAPQDDDVWTRTGAPQVVRAGHPSASEEIGVRRDRFHCEAVVTTEWDDGTTYVTEKGGEVPPAPWAGR
ncbi:hypothetical protein ACFU5P_14225 [Streptomyces sp. NPDC057433]|uniref:hypothetical protein n=1 Tax=Streptomyces sp. NPDC057433 TaxID=3346132 RepID=UPI003691127B